MESHGVPPFFLFFFSAYFPLIRVSWIFLLPKITEFSPLFPSIQPEKECQVNFLSLVLLLLLITFPSLSLSRQVIVRDESGTIHLYSKGADEVILARLASNEDPASSGALNVAFYSQLQLA